MSALGEEFRRARDARGLTLSDVAERIHIRSVYLNAIENEDWPAIGAPVYVRGFIRTYARFLGLDGEEMVARFNEVAPVERTAHVAPVVHSIEREPTRPSIWAIGGILIAVGLVILVGFEWWSYARGAGGRPVALGRAVPTRAPRAQPSAATMGSPTPATPPPTPALRHQLSIRVSEPSWIRVTVDGTTREEGILPAGTKRTFQGNVAIVRVGNAGGVTITVNGRTEPSLGKSGDVVEQRYTL